MTTNEPIYIAIDGIDGCGKSTQLKNVARFLSDRGLTVVQTREPGGTKTGTVLRNILISTEYNVEPETELFIYSADRLEHQRKVILPELENGHSVISDRFLPSTYAYQIFGRGLDKSLLDTLLNYSVTRYPDLTFIIDIKPEIALERAMRRLQRDNKMEAEGKFEQLGVTFFEKVREGFIWYASQFENVVVIDGHQHIQEIYKEMCAHIVTHLQRKKS